MDLYQSTQTQDSLQHSTPRSAPGADPGCFPQGGLGGIVCHGDAYGVLVEATEGGLGEENFEYEVL